MQFHHALVAHERVHGHAVLFWHYDRRSCLQSVASIGMNITLLLIGY
jgi:hypothetical protein